MFLEVCRCGSAQLTIAYVTRIEDEEIYHDWPWVGSWPQEDGPVTLKLVADTRRWWKPRKRRSPVVNMIFEKTETTMGKETQEEAEKRRKENIKKRKRDAEECRQGGIEKWREAEKERQRKLG